MTETGTRITADIRRAIQASDESIRTLARRHGLNPKTVAKWRARGDSEDRRPGPKAPSALSPAEEAIILALRRHAPLPLDDSLAVLRPFLPTLSRSALHRCLKRHGVSRPPVAPPDLPDAARRPGCYHIDIIALPAAPAPLYLFLAVEQTSRLAFALLRDGATQADARDFFRALADGSPAPVTLVLTDDRFQFTTPGNHVSGAADAREALEKGRLARVHPFEYACAAAGIDHHLVPSHFPWDAAQAARMEAALDALLPLLPADAAELRSALNRQLARHNATPLALLGGRSAGDYLAESDRTMGSWDETAPPVAAPPARRGRDSTREAILAAARSCLAKDGPEGLSLSEVARLAGVNRGTAYLHFRTRENLIAATSDWVSEKLYRAVFGDPAAPVPPVESVDVAGLTDRLAGFAMDNPELCRAWLLQLLSSPDPAQDMFWRRYAGAMASLGETARAQPHIDTEVASVIILAGAFLWPVWAHAPARQGVDLTAAARRFAQEGLRLSLYGNLRPEAYPGIAARLAGGVGLD